MRDIVVNDLSYGTEVDIDAGHLDSFFAVVIPLSGVSVIRNGRQQVRLQPGHAAVAAPTEYSKQRLTEGCRQNVVRIEQPVLEAHLRDLLGHPLPVPLSFRLGFEVASGSGKAFAEDLALVARRLVNDPAAYESPYATSSTEQNLMTRLLLTATHNYSDQLHGEPPKSISGRLVTAVVEIVRAHPEWNHTSRSLARAQGVSVRTLERAFRRDMGIGPMAYLRGVRLERARSALRAAAPTEVSVGAIAREWGFVSRSRFAADYRERYGELPSQTLRK